MTSTSNPEPKKQRRLARYFNNLKDSYTISRRTFPWVGWAMLAITAGVIALGVVIAFAIKQSVIYWIFLGVMAAILFDLILLTWTVRRASYTQIEGLPGAAKSALDQLSRGWNVADEPAAINPKTKDVIWRAVGRPGVVLISEGPASRASRMLAEERKKVARILPTVPIHAVQTGTEDGQVRLIKLESTLRHLPTKPTKLTGEEILQVAQRLRSLDAKGLPIPKGIDPNRARPDRKATRGR